MNKKNKIIMLLVLLLTLSGCTKYKTYDKTSITVEETGQKVVDNILCKTEETEKQYIELKNKEIKKLDEKLNTESITTEEYNKKLTEINELFNLENVDNCSEFKIFKGDDGLWTTLFVKTLVWVLIKIGTITKNYGWSIIIVTFLIRLVLYPLTKKTVVQSENMKKAQTKLNKLEMKYRNRTDQESQMRKAQEMMVIYKEYDINPMSSCLFAFIQIPLFFAFYEALYRLPLVLEETFLGINLGITPFNAIQQGKIYYVIFIILIVLVTYFSFKMNSANQVGEQANQMKTMTNIFTVMIFFSSLYISSGIAIYWIINSSFTILQNLLTKRSAKNANIS